MDSTSRSDLEYAGLGRLLKAAGVPPCRTEKLIADVLAEDAAATRSAIVSDLRVMMDGYVSSTRRTVRQSMFEIQYLQSNEFSQRRKLINISFLIVMIVSLSGISAYFGFRAAITDNPLTCAPINSIQSDFGSNYFERNR